MFNDKDLVSNEEGLVPTINERTAVCRYRLTTPINNEEGGLGVQQNATTIVVTVRLAETQLPDQID